MFFLKNLGFWLGPGCRPCCGVPQICLGPAGPEAENRARDDFYIAATASGDLVDVPVHLGGAGEARRAARWRCAIFVPIR